MADWIKMRVNLDGDPRVVQVACRLNLPELHVVGLLWKLWSWADQHTTDGNAKGVTDQFLDRIAAVTGFAAALRDVGWLAGEDGIQIPNFSDHNGESAKSRAETALRVARFRAKNAGVTDEALQVKRECNAGSVTDQLPEKRREEKKKEAVASARPELGQALDLTNGDHARLIEVWHDSFEAQFGTRYAMNGGRDGKAVKTLLRAGTVEEVMKVATAAWALKGFLAQRASTMHGLADAWNEINAELKRKETNGASNGYREQGGSTRYNPEAPADKYAGIG